MRGSLGAHTEICLRLSSGARAVLRCTFGALTLGIAGCSSERGCVVLKARAPLFAQADNHGASNPVIDTLRPGEYSYSGVHYGKDFMMFKLDRPDGRHGFLLFSGDRTVPCVQADSSSRDSGA
jgi:hypothetical protein